MMAKLTICLILLVCGSSQGFVSPLIRQRNGSFSNGACKPLFAQSNKGFGKQSTQQSTKPKPDVPENTSLPDEGSTSGTFLKSVEGGSDAIPIEQNLSPQERTKLILKQQYGLKSLAEQQLDEAQLEARQERRKKQEEWKKKASREQEFDLMTTLPAPVLLGIDRFLKAGVVICGTLFILAGLLITLEAWSKTSGQPLQDNLDNFIVGTIEPGFTPGLLVLLSFSVGLGVFAAAQLASAGATYKEDN
jgi:hypothetical protein